MTLTDCCSPFYFSCWNVYTGTQILTSAMSMIVTAFAFHKETMKEDPTLSTYLQTIFFYESDINAQLQSSFAIESEVPGILVHQHWWSDQPAVAMHEPATLSVARRPDLYGSPDF